MNHNRVEATDFEHHHITGKLLCQFRVYHGMAAEFHHDDLIIIALQKWQSFGEDARGFGSFSHVANPYNGFLRYRTIRKLEKGF